MAQGQEAPALSSVARSLPSWGQELGDREPGRGYRAVVDPAAIGLGFEVLVQVTMDREDAATVAVATADIAAYQTLRDTQLATLPGVGRLTSTIVMKRVVDGRPYSLALPPLAPTPSAEDGARVRAAPGLQSMRQI